MEEQEESSRMEEEEEEEMVRDMVLVFFCTFWTLNSHIVSAVNQNVSVLFSCVCAGLTYCAMFQAFQEAVTEVVITLYKDRSRVSDSVENKPGFVSMHVREIPSFHKFLV